MLRLFDTALGAVVPLEPRDPGRFSMYVCGPTVSGEPHLGHGRFNVVWDVCRRYIAWSGLDVRYVSNVTDIEDKIIARAEQEGRAVEEVAAHYERLWFDTMDRLGVARPTETPHATSYVDDMVGLIGVLVDSGHAYTGGDGVYFSASSVEGYGLLARQSIESLMSGARVEVAEESGKRSPVDFALWKLSKPGEPSWPSPWGAGRPGWHTECVVMSLDLLGEDFDLHTGGLDLAFPHHENERAQAVAANRRFARRWAHHGMVEDERGEKMSKSVGNTMSLLELLDAYDPRAFRLQVLQSHYRGPMTVGPNTLAAAAAGVERLDAFAREFRDARGAEPDAGALEAFRERMDDDLDTPNAVALAFDLIKDARAARLRAGTPDRLRAGTPDRLRAGTPDRLRAGTPNGAGEASAKAAAVCEIFEAALGLPLRDVTEGPSADALAKAAARDEARAAKDWARADALRAELQADGWIVEDGPQGTAIRPGGSGTGPSGRGTAQ